jgi:hypothetical protein
VVRGGEGRDALRTALTAIAETIGMDAPTHLADIV